MRTLLLVLALFAVAPVFAQTGWAMAQADSRVPLQVEGDLYARPKADVGTVLDFNELLAEGRVLAADSLALVDAASGRQLDLQLAQDTGLAYASGNPILRLRWTVPDLAPFTTRLFHLYLRTVGPSDVAVWKTLAQTFTPDKGAVALETSFEAPDPAHPDWPRQFIAAGWDQPGEKTERVWSNQVARTGTHSLRVARTFDKEQPANTNRPFWWSWPAPIEAPAGQSLRLEGWIKAVRLKGRATASLSMEFVTDKGQRLTEGQLRMFCERESPDWQYFSGVTTAPAGSQRAALQFGLYSDEGEAYCDDVKVTVVPGSTLPAANVAVAMAEPRPSAALSTDSSGQRLQVSLAAPPPVIDGALGDPCWASAGQSSDFLVHSKAADTAPVKTTVMACADHDALYFGFVCQEPSTEHLLANATQRDGELWQDDSVELLLDTARDRHTYYQIIVNSRGVFFDQDTGAPGLAGDKWNGPIAAAAKVYPDRWTAEVKLEFVGLRLAESAGSQWGVNFARSSFRGSRALYTWVPVGANFGEPARFGRLVLPFDPAANVISGRPLMAERLYFGPGEVPVEINNRRDTAAQVRAVVTREDGRPAVLGEVTVTAPPRGSTIARVPCAFTRGGEATLRYDLLEQPQGKLLYATTVTHLVPEPLALEPAERIIYATEPATGHWVVGLDTSTRSSSQLELSLTRAGATKPDAAQTVPLKGGEGAYSLVAARLTPGRYNVNVRLVSGGQVLGQAAYVLDCISGPFGPPR
jgi:hypothetical protein